MPRLAFAQLVAANTVIDQVDWQVGPCTARKSIHLLPLTETTMTKPSIVVAHGLWADGSCFSKLIPTLQTEGHDVMASQHGLDSLATDVAAVKACLARVSSPAILVGHSYGGSLITHAGTD